MAYTNSIKEIYQYSDNLDNDEDIFFENINYFEYFGCFNGTPILIIR